MAEELATLSQLGLCSEQIKDVKEDLLTSEQLASYRFKYVMNTLSNIYD